jgi:tRNA threonylcarbamoyladenosine biosynthesis protein TsaB
VILALDSATSALSIALLETGADGLVPILEQQVMDGGKHGQRLPQVLEELLGQRGLGPKDLEACAVGLGPGSFTGLRVGLATMKGLCYARRIPLWGVSSLRAMAREQAERLPSGQEERLHCPLLDARRGELYAGLYRGPFAERAADEVVLPPDALPGWLLAHGGAEAVLLGEGLHAHLQPLRSAPGAQLRLDLEGPRTPSARVVAQLARSSEPFRLEALFALEPHYLRPFTADPPRAKPASAARRLPPS